MYTVSSSVWQENKNWQLSDEYSQLATSALGKSPFTKFVHIIMHHVMSRSRDQHTGFGGSLKTRYSVWLIFHCQRYLSVKNRGLLSQLLCYKYRIFSDVFYYKHKTQLKVQNCKKQNKTKQQQKPGCLKLTFLWYQFMPGWTSGDGGGGCTSCASYSFQETTHYVRAVTVLAHRFTNK